ncbi:MAG: Ig-like domain-containing protein [Clostridiales bacterium]|nr:Ig-like domain-containing protein [Clostridiales bacterium]
MKLRDTLSGMRLLLPLVGVVALLSACASIGRPEGGPRDVTPPVYVRSNPEPGATSFKGNKIQITFDENIKLEDIVNKFVVSPAQKQMPSISSNGRNITIELRDTMLENTTYTLDLSDAVRDLNEGNILDGFALDFATGDTIDSLRIAGMVLQASNLEPAQGMLVGVYSNLDDSAITTLPMLRIAKTNQLGQFIIRNLKPGTYNVFAINDLNRDYHWDRSEDIAFYPITVTPTVENITVADTLKSSAGTDSIVTHPGVRYLPNDLLLTWFNENYTSQYLKDYKRNDSNRIAINFSAPADSLPQLTIVNGPNAGRRLDTPDASVLIHSATLDTLDFWITDPAIMAQDSLLIATRYQRTDTLDQLSWTTDTLRFFYKAPPKGKEKKASKNKKNKDNTPVDSLGNPIEKTDTTPAVLRFLDIKIGGTTQEVNLPLSITMSEPLVDLDQQAWHMEQKVDTVWTSLPTPLLKADTTGRLLNYTIDYPWEAGEKYRLTVDSASVHSIYGLFNKNISQEISVRPAEDYSTLIFNLKGVPDSASVIVEVLNASDAPLRSVKAINGVARIEYLLSGTYYARAYVDTNGDGKWTTGNMARKLLPEDVYYYPKKINLKKNWDVANDWDLNELPVDMQKPTAIKKNKPKTKERNRDRDEYDEEEDDEYGGYGYNDMGRPGYDNRNPFDNRSGGRRESLNRANERR